MDEKQHRLEMEAALRVIEESGDPRKARRARYARAVMFAFQDAVNAEIVAAHGSEDQAAPLLDAIYTLSSAVSLMVDHLVVRGNTRDQATAYVLHALVDGLGTIRDTMEAMAYAPVPFKADGSTSFDFRSMMKGK